MRCPSYFAEVVEEVVTEAMRPVAVLLLILSIAGQSRQQSILVVGDQRPGLFLSPEPKETVESSIVADHLAFANLGIKAE